MTDLWTVVAQERAALVRDLRPLTAERWATPSWCAGWTVEDVVAHLSGTASTTPAGFVLGLARNGFRFERFVDDAVRRNTGATPGETLRRLSSLERSTDAPPGPRTSWLGEVIVHGEDIRRPLGIVHAYPMDAVRQAADFYKGSNALLGSRRRVAGVQLRATDTDWSHGEGSLVEGPMMSLLLAMTGRGQALVDLAGPGVEVLRGRR